MYVLIVWGVIFRLWKNGNALKRDAVDATSKSLLMVNEATLVGFCGLVVCSVFLSLQEFEIFFFLNVLANSVLYIARKPSADKEQGVDRFRARIIGTPTEQAVIG
jgi:hypothetical protein